MVVDPLDAVGDPELRSALLFVRGSDGAVTVDELAAQQGVHRNVARARLERLAAAGLVDSGFERRSGRAGPGAGRPAKTYRAAPQLDTIEFPARHYELLLGLFADTLPRRRLRDVGVAFGKELARAAGVRRTKRVRDGLERVCAAVRSLGYQASLEGVDGASAVIVTPTCPLRPLVAARPDAAVIDHGMWSGLVEAAVAGVEAHEISCETSDCLLSHAACRVHLRLSPRVAS